MSNLMKVPHTVLFEAIIDLDKVPARLLPALIALDETAIQQMCKGATLHALAESNVLQTANENNTWAEVTIKEGN
jgi:16S rRNA U516 pseudouridylate synthase RsuA-like enzyme